MTLDCISEGWSLDKGGGSEAGLEDSFRAGHVGYTCNARWTGNRGRAVPHPISLCKREQYHCSQEGLRPLVEHGAENQVLLIKGH